MLFHKHKIIKTNKKSKKMQPVDKMMFVVSFLYPFTAIPQLYQVYSTQDISSLSLISWSLYVVFASIFFAYSVSKKLKPLIIEGFLWLLIDILMVIAIIIYS